ncbi:MAG: HIT family protein [Candidatus Izemoplasmatales bacterium]
MNCIFCKIVEGVIPSYKIYEDDILIAILDISQATKGHTLVIPKTHFKNLYEIEQNLAGEIFKVIPKLANGIKNAFNPIGLNVLINTEKPLQTVDHFHIHLIPRYENDKVEIDFVNHQKEMNEDLYKKIQHKITEELEKK